MTKLFRLNATRFALVAMILLLAFGTMSFAQGQRYKSTNAWSFGVMGDTQWTNSADPEGKNPEYVSAAIAGALNGKFIENGVRFVIQVGDLTDRAGDAGLAARAAAAQPLLDAGIGFFPLRGNHETYGWLYFRDPDNNLNIPAFKSNFPQTQGLANTFGTKNFSSPDIDVLKGLSYSFDYGNTGNNARFVVVDVEATTVSTKTPEPHPTYGPGAFYFQFTVYKHTSDLQGTTGAYEDGVWKKVPATIPAGEYFRISGGKPTTDFYGWNNGIITRYNPGGNIWPIADYLSYVSATVSGEKWPGQQQSWISAQLDKTTRGTEHAFVFSHRGMMGANHADGFFGADPSVSPADQNVFVSSLMNNDVKYLISAHDHIHNRALVASPDGTSQIGQIITTGASTKFYAPASLDDFAGQKPRETMISQEIRNIGYYIYTVDGPRVTVDYYSDANGNFMDDADYPYGDASIPARLYMPQFSFIKKETFGYSTNGQQFVIPQGKSYTAVADSFGGTTAKILAGINSSTATDYSPTIIDDKGTPDDTSDDVIVSEPRPLNKVVNTGWTTINNPMIASNIVSLWGMEDFGRSETDVYVLSMTYSEKRVNGKHLGNGGYRLAGIDASGQWVNAVDLNIGKQKKKFVKGPYKPGYGLGTYGIDQETGTVWAVINYCADFAAYKF
ncbi:MAG: metallophosphoesterase [Acidobacteriota bacterium]|nr:metallophosphoesterase [Acidobacteriota bacterium]